MTSSAETSALILERRAVPDRRRRATTLLGSLRFGGRRRGFRRAGEEQNRYVDCPSREIVLLSFLTVILSVLDALFTLLHLEGGGREVNPLMALALGAGMTCFLSLKIGITGLGVVFLAIHQNFRLSRLALHGIALAYSALLAYHSVLFIAARI